MGTGKGAQKPKYAPEKFLEKLLLAYVPFLGHRMGALYRDMVYELLAGSEITGMQQPVSLETEMEAGVTDGDIGENSHWASVVSRLVMCRA
jgi:hypothetical protein